MKRLSLAFALLFLTVSNVFAQVQSASSPGFLENKGQWPTDVLYLTRMSGLDAWITKNGIVYDFYQIRNASGNGTISEQNLHPYMQDGASRSGHVVRIHFDQGLSSSFTEELNPQSGYYNFFIGTAVATEVMKYNEVIVREIYRGVDVRYYFEGNNLRYDFIVHPGGDPSQIRMRLEGTETVSLGADGALMFATRFGMVAQRDLYSYQLKDEVRAEVKSRFVVDGKIVSMNIGSYDPNADLIIDPVLWSTFIGGNAIDQMQGIDIDAAGNVCLAGLTASTNYPVTVGAYDLSYNSGTYDVAVSKLDPSGSTLIFSTFIGGSLQDQANALRVDSNGDFYIGGQTNSTNYPVTGAAYDQVSAGLNEAFVTKLSANGTTLLYSTYLGGTGQDYCYGIEVDATGAAFVTGIAGSNDYPTTPGAYDVAHNGGTNDVFVTKLNPAGSALSYSTFFGGASGEIGYAIAIDNSGCAYVTGYTTSVILPVTVGAYGQTYTGGASEGFVIKLNATGSTLNYCTFLGGVSDDRLYGIAVDATGSAYVTGLAYNGVTPYPTTAGAYDQTFNGGTSDIVVTKLNPTASALTYSTFIGGSSNDFATAISLDANGNAAITGYVTSTNYPTTAGAYDASYNGGTYDVPATVLSANGATLVYSTFLGGASDEYGLAVVYGTGGAVFVTGSTQSSGFPVTAGAYDQSFNTNADVFVTKVSSCTAPVITTGSNSPVCIGQSINLTSSGGTSYAWSGPSGYTSSSQNPVISNAATTNAGTYTVTVTNALGCATTGTVNVVVGPTATAGSSSPVCSGQTLNLTATGGTTYAWTGPNSFASSSQNPNITSVTTAAAGTYSVIVTDANGCSNTLTVSVVVNGSPSLTASSNAPVCAGQNLNLSASTVAGVSYSWSGPNSFTSTSQNPIIPAATTVASGTYTVTATNGAGCTGTSTVSVVVNPLPTATASSNTPICSGQTLNLSAGSGISYSWSGPNSFASSLQNPSIGSATAANAGTYTVTVSGTGGCTATATTSVVVNTLPTPTASSNSPLCVGQTLNLSSGGGATYVWSGPSAFNHTIQNPSLPNVTAGNAGTYTVLVTNANGCTATATTNVVVNAVPVATASSNTPVCAGQTLNLSAATVSGATYAWSGPNSFASSVQNPSIAAATVAASGTYTLVVTNVSGCSATTTVTAAVNALPVVSSGSNSPVCAGSVLNLTAGGGSTYAWSGPNSFSSSLQNPVIGSVTLAATGTYSLTVTSAAGCSATANVGVTVNALPSATAGSSSPVCEGQNINLSSGGGITYSWNGPSGFSDTQQNPVIIASTLMNAGVYTVTVTDANTCSATSTVNVVVNALPNATATSNSPVCEGSPLNLNAGGGGTYQWNGPASFNSTQQNNTIAAATTADAGTYSVLVTDVNGCSATASIVVVVDQVPVASATSTGPYCQGNNIQLSATGGSSWSWAGPNSFTSSLSNPVISNASSSASGTYTVTVSTPGGCSDTATVAITVSTVDTAVMQNGPVLTANASGAIYQWIDCSTSQPVNGATSQVFSAPQIGQYALVITENGCTDTSGCFTVLSVGMNEETQSAVTVFPNPANESVTLQWSAGFADVAVAMYDVTGKLVYAANGINSSSHTIALQQPAGVYFIEVISGDQISRVRLVVE